MAVAIVTGASSGIGLEISKSLLSLGYSVWGIARDFTRASTISNDAFHPAVCDLSDLKAVQSVAEKILRQHATVDVLVHNAGVGFFGPHETISVGDIAAMVNTNLLAPMVLTKLFLRAVKASRGHLITIASYAALSPHRMGCAYAATKAGILQFNESLFDEARKAGVKVCTICPDMTADTAFYEHAAFECDEDPECSITPACVARAVSDILSRRDGTVQTLTVLRPQRVGMAHKKS